MDEKIVVGHDEIRHLFDVMHYDDHPDRVETAEFSHNKKTLHEKIKNKEIAPCDIHNGYCEGQVEIHHYYVEYSEGTAVDWNKVKEDCPIDNPDQMPNLIPLCHKHHMGVGTGIHMMSNSAYRMQKYLNAKNIAMFEAAIKHLRETMHPKSADKTHPDHHIVNAKANAILHVLAQNQAKEESTATVTV